MLNLLRRYALAMMVVAFAVPANAQGLGQILGPMGQGGGPAIGGTDLNTSCDANQGTACGNRESINHLDICFDGDEDGVCDDKDECQDTPAGTPVFFNGCHLQTGKAMVLNGINFEFDRADLTADSKPILERAVEVLQGQSDVLVSVDGHTDNLGSDAYNETLSWQRVRSVYTYFVKQGIDPARLAYRGFGESSPVSPNQNADGSDNPAGRAANRRVELNVLDQMVFHGIKENNSDRFARVPTRTPRVHHVRSPAPVETKPEPEPADEPEPETETEAEVEATSSAAAGSADGYEAFETEATSESSSGSSGEDFYEDYSDVVEESDSPKAAAEKAAAKAKADSAAVKAAAEKAKAAAEEVEAEAEDYEEYEYDY